MEFTSWKSYPKRLERQLSRHSHHRSRSGGRRAGSGLKWGYVLLYGEKLDSRLSTPWRIVLGGFVILAIGENQDIQNWVYLFQ